MHESEDPDYYDVDSPPLFSPHVFVPERGEKITFGAKGYMMRLSPFMVSDYDTTRPILAVAKKYNIRVNWKRVLEMYVHEAHDLEKQTGTSVHDVRIKVVVGDEVRRTRIVPYDRDLTSVWNESLKFYVASPCPINILAYCKNKVIPNDKIGRISILPLELVERDTITEWFPFNTKGISLSPPALTPFKFKYNSVRSASDWHILDEIGERLFTVVGQWPYAMSVCNYNASITDVLSIRNVVFKALEKEFDIKYGTVDTQNTVTLIHRGEHEFEVKGLTGIDSIRSYYHDFSMYSKSQLAKFLYPRHEPRVKTV